MSKYHIVSGNGEWGPCVYADAWGNIVPEEVVRKEEEEERLKKDILREVYGDKSEDFAKKPQVITKVIVNGDQITVVKEDRCCGNCKSWFMNTRDGCPTTREHWCRLWENFGTEWKGESDG